MTRRAFAPIALVYLTRKGTRLLALEKGLIALSSMVGQGSLDTLYEHQSRE